MYSSFAEHGIISKGRTFLISDYWDLNAGVGTYVGCYLPNSDGDGLYLMSANSAIYSSVVDTRTIPFKTTSKNKGRARLFRTISTSQVSEAGYIKVE